MFTFLHAADIHLDSPLRGLEAYADAPVEQLRQATRRAFDNLIDLAIEEQAAFILLAGDLYDGEWKDYNTGLFFIDRLSRLRKEKIRVFLASGNHDAASQITKALRLPDNVHLFSTKQPETVTLENLGVAVHGQGYDKRALTENIARNYPPAFQHYLNIGLLHTSLTGRQGHEPYAPCSPDDLRAKGYDYWALGHVHIREEVSRSPWIVFPGNIQGRHIHEAGAKGATLVRVEEGRIASVEHRDLDVLRWSMCRVDLAACATMDLAIVAVRQAMEREQANGDGRPLAIRLQLIGESPLHAELHRDSAALTEEFRGLAAGIGEMWLEKVQFATRRPVALAESLGTETPMADLVQVIDRLDFQPATLLELIPEIGVLQSKLPPELVHEGGLFPTSTEDTSNLCEEVKEMLIARLLGQGGKSMRISRLELKAFGRFTDRTLELGPGLHIVHGPNEAGKSTTLRALKAWLFGFPERTHDNFLHANEQLQVGGCLQAEDGRELVFYRRKKRKADILDPDGNPLEASALAAFLPMAEQAIFESLYGLSHEDLIRGGEDILAQKGEVGQALFSAGAGISSLRGVLAGLESEAEALFTARGTKREINEALAAYKETQRIVRETSLSSREWQELNNSLTEAQAALQTIEEHQGAKERRRRQLERIQQLLPQLALRNALRQQLAELGEVVELSDNFSSRRQEVERTLHSIGHKETSLVAKLAAMQEKMTAVTNRQPLIDAEDAIEELHQRLGEYKKGREDRPRLEGMRISNKGEAAEFLKLVRQDIPLEQVESLRAVSGRRKITGLLAAKHEGLQQGLSQSEKRLLEIGGELARIDRELTGLPQAKNAAGLSQALRNARKSGEIDADIENKIRALAEKRHFCLQALERLPLWSGSLDQFLALRLPLPDTVRKYESIFNEHGARQRDIQQERERLHKRMAEVQADIRQREISGNAPTEEELVLIRTQRDKGWELLRRQWLKGEDLAGEDVAFAQELPLPDAYEKKVALADTVADRLRHEADRVQAFAALRAEKQSLKEALADLEREADKNSLARTDFATEWQALWEPGAIIPMSPPEMLAWLGGVTTIRQSADELQANERELTRKNSDREDIKSALLQELAGLGEQSPRPTKELEPLLLLGEAAEKRLAAIEEKRQRLLEKKIALDGEHTLAQSEKTRFTEEFCNWRREWQEVVGDLGGNREIHPAEAGDLLENLHLCFSRLKEADDLRKRIEGIDRDTKKFEETALTLAQKIAPALKGQPAGQIVTQLKALLNQARNDRTLQARYIQETEEAEEEKRRLAEDKVLAQQQIAELCCLAGKVLPEELEAAEKRSAQFRSLVASLAQSEKILIEGAGGLPLAELEVQAAKIDPDALPEEITRLTQEIEQNLAPEGKRLSGLIGEKKNQLRQMDGNAKAAEAAEQGARLLAKIRRLAERYIQLKVAGHVLKSEIERFRSENQGPVLAITSRYFSELTLGSFAGLLTDENDQGDPVLVGARPNGARVLVERMSSGTRDQLYLALRLASLEWRLEGHEPMPFILDDILVNADDARSKAALKILGELAAKTQVILFTHHRRIVDEALQLAPISGLQVHELVA